MTRKLKRSGKPYRVLLYFNEYWVWPFKNLGPSKRGAWDSVSLISRDRIKL